jgi:chromosome segregation ATPase
MQHYKDEVSQLKSKLHEALNDKRAIEEVSNEAMSMQDCHQEQLRVLTSEREELRSTIDHLRETLKKVSENHEDHLLRYQNEIEDLHGQLESANKSQRTLENIAAEALEAQKLQEEDTRIMTNERNELKSALEVLRGNLDNLSVNHESNIHKYQAEIRQLHGKVEEVQEEKRLLRKSADDARFSLELQTEQIRRLQLEREELSSNLSMLKGCVKKVSEEHSDHLRQFKEEVQGLHTKLDHAVIDKLAAEKAADEIRFGNDDLVRKVKDLEDELLSYCATNKRLEELRAEDQAIIARLNNERRSNETGMLDVENLKAQLLRMKRHKEQLDDLVAHQKEEFIQTLKSRDDEIAAYRSKQSILEEELDSLQSQLTLIRKEKDESTEQIISLQQDGLELKRDLHAKDETIARLQSDVSRLESNSLEDRRDFKKLKSDLQEKETEVLALKHNRHKVERLQHDNESLQRSLHSRKEEYRKLVDIRDKEREEYMSQIEALKRKVETGTSNEKAYRHQLSDQIQTLRESESSLFQLVRQRDGIIEQLRLDLSTMEGELSKIKLHEKANTNREINHLQQQLADVELRLSSTRKERDDAVRQAKSKWRAYSNTLEDLEKARDDSRRYKVEVGELHEELSSRQEKIVQMESKARRFQDDIKEKVSSIMCSTAALETTRRANQELTDNIAHLERLVESLRRERNACIASLENGQRKLSQLTSTTGQINTPEHRNNRLVASELYITSHAVGGDHPELLLPLRAEEIASCVAMSARKSLHESEEETSNLRSKVFQLQEEKTAEVSALKAKIRNLEREMSYEQQQRIR